MKRLLVRSGILALLMAVPVLMFPKGTDGRVQTDNLTINPGEAFTCNTGEPASLLVGAAVIGLVLRKRR